MENGKGKRKEAEMERCDYCDEEFEYDDWIEADEPQCTECNVKFCGTDCKRTHLSLGSKECREAQ